MFVGYISAISICFQNRFEEEDDDEEEKKEAETLELLTSQRLEALDIKKIKNECEILEGDFCR